MPTAALRNLVAAFVGRPIDATLTQGVVTEVVSQFNLVSHGVGIRVETSNLVVLGYRDVNVESSGGTDDVALVAGSTTNGDLTTSGALYAGNNLIGVGGNSVLLNAGTSITSANGSVTLVADETAGTSVGVGQFINNVPGLNIQAANGDVGIYAVAGGTVPFGSFQISIGADGLSRFDRSGLKDLLPEGRAKLELLARELKGNFARVVGITVIGTPTAWVLRLTTCRCRSTGPKRSGPC